MPNFRGLLYQYFTDLLDGPSAPAACCGAWKCGGGSFFRGDFETRNFGPWWIQRNNMYEWDLMGLMDVMGFFRVI